MPSSSLISLYTGAGGLDYGFEAAGFETAVAIEMDHDCCETLRANRPWPVIERDIFAVSTREMLSRAGLQKGQAALLIGGPPCQPFSKSGYWARGDSRRLDDPRASTLHAYIRVVEEALPEAFLLENVPGLAFNGKDEGLQLLLSLLEGVNVRTGANYVPHVGHANAADFGVPQIRERVFIVASREGLPFRFPSPTHAPSELTVDGQVRSGLASYRTAWDALADVTPGRGEALRVTGKWAALLPSIPEGQNYLFHTDRGGGVPLFGWRRRFWNFLLKLAKDLPAWTIQAQPGPATGPFHWDNRHLSMRELCQLQTFPPDVRITGNRRDVQKQVGNAVPSLLAEVLGREIGAQLLGSELPAGPLKLLPPDRSPYPARAVPTPVPAAYRHLAGTHSPHPGTGLGNRANPDQQLLAL